MARRAALIMQALETILEASYTAHKNMHLDVDVHWFTWYLLAQNSSTVQAE